MKPQVRAIIQDTHMGLGHSGLNEIIRLTKKKDDIFKKNIASGGMILFVNAAKTAAKLYYENGEVIGYLRMPNNAKLTEANIDLIPRTFGGSVEYASAVKSGFKKYFEMEKESKMASKAALYA